MKFARLKGKKIIVGVCGSIAAYKAAMLVRLLVKEGAETQVIMTDRAKDFISPLTLSTLSKRPVIEALHSDDMWNNHIHLAREADALLIAPCTANTLAKMANGICDNALLAVYLSAACPTFIAPAMDEGMWDHPVTQRNARLLLDAGHAIIPIEEGELASGLIGKGRMAEPQTIVEFVCARLQNKKPVAPRFRALVNAGPTYEPLDPVRFIGNFSSGKMGVAIANAFAQRNVEVDLVLGPSRESVSHPLIRLYRVNTAEEMAEKCISIFPSVDIAVLAAAVADFRPAERRLLKIKKENAEELYIKFIKNTDILSELGKLKTDKQTLAGFALETDNEIENARRKLLEKNADIIILNSMKDPEAGFGGSKNKVRILRKNGEIKETALLPKEEIAAAIIDDILKDMKG